MLDRSSARSWSSAASVSPAPRRGPARFLRPIPDARLGDGSRVAICVPPASPHLAITVRRFGTRSFSAAQLITQGALPAHIPDEAERVLHTRRNILVSGGTASGNTTLLNALIALIPDDQRIVAIEDTLELPIDSPNRASGSRRAGYSRQPSRSATSCATPCGTGPIISSSAKCAAPKRPTCCKPSTPESAARPPRHHPGERLPPRGRAGRPHPAALGQQSVRRRWRGRDR